MTRALLIALTLAACSAAPRREPDTAPAPEPVPTATPTPAPAAGTPAPIPPSPPGSDPCPALQIKAPDAVPAGTQVRIASTLIGGAGAPTFRWSVSAGKIASGQGTANIVVDSTGLAGTSIVATVEMGGLAKECATTGTSVSILVGP